MRTNNHEPISTVFTHRITQITRTLLASSALFAALNSSAFAQVSTHPEAKSPIPKNEYLQHSDPWRWDVKSQLMLRGGIRYGWRDEEYRYRNTQNPRQQYYETVVWEMSDVEVVFPATRSGGFFWSPNTDVEVSIRADDFTREPQPERWFTNDTKAEYTLWRSDINDTINLIHVIHTSHVVSADTKFDQTKARNLPWPDTWSSEANAFLEPIIDSVGEDNDVDAEDTIQTLLDYWVENKDPKMLNELDLVKFLTGKVIEHVKVQTPPAEFSRRSGNRHRSVAFIGGTAWSGFIVRPANRVAKDPAYSSKHDLATLLTSILRTAGVPARTVICVDQSESDVLEKMVSLVEFAMYDPQSDATLWIPIDIDRLRLNGKRSNQYTQWWNYFGTHDRLSHYIPVANYFHPPASYRGNDLPALYGVRSSSELPDYIIQSLVIDPQVSVVTSENMKPNKDTP